MLFHKKTRAAALAALAVSVALVATGCAAGDSGSGSDGGEGDGGNLSITFLPKNLGNPYFDTSNAGGEEAIEEFGGTFAEVGPAEATPDGQVSYINTLTQQGVGAIAVSANDPKAICDALNEARDAGVKVVTFDSDTNADCRDLFVNQADSEGIAKVQVDLIAEQIGDAGEIAVLSASANATNQNAWIDLMKEELAANHPDIELVEVVYGDDDDQTSFDKTAALLQTHPNLKGIVSPTTVGIAAAARYLQTSEYQGKVALTASAPRTRCASTSRTAPSRRSRCGTRPTSATWPRSHRRRSSRATSRAPRVTPSTRASSASTPSAPTASCSSATPTCSTRRTSATSTSSRSRGSARRLTAQSPNPFPASMPRARRSRIPRFERLRNPCPFPSIETIHSSG